MITHQQGKDQEIDFLRGAIVVGHAFNTGTKKKIQLQVYTADYGKHVQVSRYEDADAWILEQLQGGSLVGRASDS